MPRSGSLTVRLITKAVKEPHFGVGDGCGVGERTTEVRQATRRRLTRQILASRVLTALAFRSIVVAVSVKDDS